MRILNTLIEFIFPDSKEERHARLVSVDELVRKAKRARTDSVTSNLGSTSVFSYKDTTVRQMIWLLKYRRDKKVAERFGAVLAEHLLEELSDRVLFGGVGQTTVIPIPLSNKRQHERGFNQSELIAKELVKRIPELSLLTDVLIKTVDSEHQAQARSKRARIENVTNSFALKNVATIKNKDVILIDDVITTGATMAEAKKTLYAGGARSVFPVSVAH
jgi:ComF family protein